MDDCRSSLLKQFSMSSSLCCFIHLDPTRWQCPVPIFTPLRVEDLPTLVRYHCDKSDWTYILRARLKMQEEVTISFVNSLNH